MKVRLLWVGKTREPWAGEAVSKYVKLIRPFAEIEIVEIKDLKGKGAQAVKDEGERILKSVSRDFILLDERGAESGSVKFADKLRDRARIEFVIGGPYGVSDEVKRAAAGTIRLSSMTLTHEMARIVLLEQIYRGFTIIAGRGYHH